MSLTDVQTVADIVAGIHQIETHAVNTVATVRSECNEQIRGLKATVAKLADDLHTERVRADALDAAVPALVAEHVRREQALEAEAGGLLRANFALQDALDDLHGRFDAEHVDNRRNAEHVARLVADIRDLTTELAGQPVRRMLRRRVR